MLEFLALCIGPWIDIIEDNIPPLSCTLSETDSSTTAGWLQKSNFKDDDKSEVHEHCKLELARNHASRLLTNEIKDNRQFLGNQNNVADSLQEISISMMRNNGNLCRFLRERSLLRDLSDCSTLDTYTA